MSQSRLSKAHWPSEGGPIDRILKSGEPWRTWMVYKTGTGNSMDMVLDQWLLRRAYIPTVTEQVRMEACGPCKGRNGGCPGYAPAFKKIFKGYEYVLVLALHFDMAWAIQYATPHTVPGKGKSRPFRHLRYADRLTDNLMHRLRTAIVNECGFKSLSLGNCEGCSSTKLCTVLQGEPCRNPKGRTFSIEATGVDVDALHHQLYAEHMPWYYKDTHAIPTYMSRYVMLLSKEPISPHIFTKIEMLTQKDKSIVGIGHLPWTHLHMPEYDRVLIREPNHGHVLWVYVDPPVVEAIGHNFEEVKYGEKASRKEKKTRTKAKIKAHRRPKVATKTKTRKAERPKDSKGHRHEEAGTRRKARVVARRETNDGSRRTSGSGPTKHVVIRKRKRS